MRSILEKKKGSVAELPGFFQVMLLVVVFAGLTFIVLDKFLDATESGSTAESAINESTNALYDYGIGFLGIIILVTMVYLIIRIVSGGGRRR
jgi:hypothetical protein